MNNIQKAEELLIKGVEEKKRGNYGKAKELYLESLRYNTIDPVTYLNLGKIGYLLEEYNLAIRAYLSFMHLQLHIRERKEQGIINYDLFEKQNNDSIYESLSDNIKSILPKKSALLILQDPNTPRHLAHALLDEDSMELRPYSSVYKKTLEGKDIRFELDKNDLSEEEYMDFENNQYIGFGREQLLDLIRWDKLLSSDVLRLYFK